MAGKSIGSKHSQSRKNQRVPSRSSRWSESGLRTPGEGEWFIAGANGVREALRSPRVHIRRLFLDRRGLGPEMKDWVSSFKGSVEEIEDKDTPYGPLTQGIAALVSVPRQPDPEDLVAQLNAAGKKPLFVALDQIEDPMNLGQILRTCEGAGVDGVILLKHRSTHLNQTAAQVSQGAYAWMPCMEVTNLRNTLDMLKERGLWVVGCEGSEDARPWYECALNDAVVLVFGAEGKGMRQLTRKTCDVLGSLPMCGNLESLNVGAAVSAFVYEAARQRKKV